MAEWWEWKSTTTSETGGHTSRQAQRNWNENDSILLLQAYAHVESTKNHTSRLSQSSYILRSTVGLVRYD